MKNPNKSGRYVVLSEYGYIGTVNYSKKYDLWSSYDFFETREKAEKNAIYNIVGWIEEEKFIEFIKENGGQNAK